MLFENACKVSQRLKSKGSREGRRVMKPLEGIKVVDLTTYMATPATGRVLGEWGADVIKVEAS